MRNKPRNLKKNAYRAKKDKKTDLEGNELSLGSIKEFMQNKRLRKIIGLFFILLSLFLLLSFISYLFSWKADDDLLNGRVFNWDLLKDASIVADNLMGRLGAITAHLFIKKWFGISSFLFVLMFFIAGFKLLFGHGLLPAWKTLRYSSFFLIWTSLFFGAIIHKGPWLILGGTFGFQANVWLKGVIGGFGTALFLLFSLGTFLILAFDPNFVAVGQFIRNLFSGKAKEPEMEIATSGDDTEEITPDPFANEEEPEQVDDFPIEIATGENEPMVPVEAIARDPVSEDRGLPLEIVEGDGKITGHNYQAIDDPNQLGDDSDMPDLSHLGQYDPTLDLPKYQIPDLSLLDDRGSSSIHVNKQELEANKNKIIETLNNYSIQIERIKATVGPTVTLYEIIPAPGVRISRIRNLEDDIALSLSALGIRIIAPIPGRGTIGIEVPNSNPEIVSMRSILASEKFQNSTFELPIGLGKTIANETFIADLTKMPHLLMAGATGQGKSVGLNAILASILYKKHPAYVKLVLIDPKKVELTLFSKIERHYLAKLPDAEDAIVNDTRQVIRTLNSLTIEMDNRYDLLKDAQVRNIKEYNAKFVERKLNPNHGHRFLPYIVLFIDEFADLIMTAGKEIELPIARLAQLSRAVGLHLIIATQRPSVNIITGTIKANFPARIAFRVASKIDSRTILDTGGADQLIGRGDMLLSTGSDLIRLQCAFIDTPEIDRITEFIGSQRAYPDAFHLPEYYDEDGGEAEPIDPSERDELFEDAARIIVATQQGSTSLLQRKLKLGYNRAGRIIDQLEAAGIVGPFEGSKAREVKIKDSVVLEQILRGE
ncbi:MAG: DNA translocase FtsK [Bacteroidales bacterium]|jgi:S-DNA-T family DNA segregation ATPase FtsK/SpoIIIE|nr:DNA translocase FtsK [Bacteroidales bacterium]NLM93582.1 DNA translocase FtsK [Bacteroidales bacterium]